MYRESISLHGPVYSIFNGRIAAIDPASGRVRWTVVTDAIMQKPTMVADAASLYVFVDGALMAFAAEDGRLRWRTPTPVETVLRLELHAGLVLLQTQGRLRAFGIMDGILRWETPSSNVVVAPPGS